MVGTYGYIAPEYLINGLCTVKTDCYAYGVVMLELLTGAVSMDHGRPGAGCFTVFVVMMLIVNWYCSHHDLVQQRVLLDLCILVQPFVCKSTSSMFRLLTHATCSRSHKRCHPSLTPSPQGARCTS